MIVTIANPIYDSVFKYLMEDEYFTVIENRDTTIMLREQEIKELGAQLAEKDVQLAEKEGQLAEKEKALLLSAKALKDAGIPLEQIAVMTSVPIDVIENL